MIEDIIKEINKLEYKIKSDKDFQKENPYALLSFVELLYLYMSHKFPSKKDSFIYKKAHINAKHFSKIRNPLYHPSRKTIIALGLALELDLIEFEALLASANYALSLNNKFDIVIIYCVQNKIYDLYTVNEIIYELGL